MKPNLRSFILAATLAATPSLALAHPGDHEHMGVGAIAHHIATSPDHLMEVIMLGLMVGGQAWRTRRRAQQRAQR